MSSGNFTELAQNSTHEEFVEACEFLFLIGSGARGKNEQPDFADEHTFTKPAGAEPPQRGAPVVLAVRKVQQMFPSMITLGRTSNNDLTLASSQISKFHAYFRVLGGRLELGDAGSRNGTWVGPQRLQPKAAPVPVRPGDRVRFGHFDFRLVDAGSCWDELRRAG